MEVIEMGTKSHDGAIWPSPHDVQIITQATKRPQLRRIFGFLPTLALSSTLLASWEAVGSSFAAGLMNGGPTALVYGMLLSISGTLALAASLSEMASICPVAGAQYQWTFMFAPEKSRAFITRMQGWITVFAWQATATSITYLTATQIQGLIILNYDEYEPQRWHGTALMIAVLFTFICINIWGMQLLPAIELVGGILHITLFIVIVVALVILAPRSSPEFVFTGFINQGGWQSDGVSWCIGLLTVVYCFVGFDGAIHLSEEIRDAPRTVPRVIMLTIAINATLAFSFVIVLLFCIGDIATVLGTNTGYPIIALLWQATQSKAVASAMMAGIIIIAFSSGFALLASVSRLTFAFARDGGMPYSEFFATVDPRYCIPVRSVLLVSCVIALLSLINIASSAALNAILSLTTLALYVSYLIPIGLLVIKRLRKERIDLGPWNLGNFGLAVNLYALAFGTFIIIFLPFPASVAQPLTMETMNYAGPVFLCVLLLALGDWFFRGRRNYDDPIMAYRRNNTSLWSPQNPEIVTVVVKPKLFDL